MLVSDNGGLLKEKRKPVEANRILGSGKGVVMKERRKLGV